MALLLVAPVCAIVFGTRAFRRGKRAAFIPVIIGAAAGLYFVITNTLPVLVSAVIG